MFEVVAQIEFSNLADPQVMTQSLALIILTILGLIAQVGYRLRNAPIFIVWALTVIVLIFSFITSLEFIWFWIMVLVDVLLVSVVASVRYLIS